MCDFPPNKVHHTEQHSNSGGGDSGMGRRRHGKKTVK